MRRPGMHKHPGFLLSQAWISACGSQMAGNGGLPKEAAMMKHAQESVIPIIIPAIEPVIIQLADIEVLIWTIGGLWTAAMEMIIILAPAAP